MPAGWPRFPMIQRMAGLMLLLEILASVALIGYAIYGLVTGSLAALDRGFILLLAGGVVALVLGVLMYGQLLLMQKLEGNVFRLYSAAFDSLEQSRRQTEMIHTIAENASMSDWVKKVVHREKDHEFLRDTIHASIVRRDWEAAEHLIDALDEELGYGEEAAALREDVVRAREATIEEQIERAMRRFEQLCQARKWDQAAAETSRLAKLFPGNERIAGLESELEFRRQDYKRHLLKQYDQAASRNDIEKAHQLLLELDRYLAPNEAAALQESARGVFKAKLMQMGVQFSLAVSDKKFEEAIGIGERLVREFPNSRYAHEITQMLPRLRERASEVVTHEI